MLRKIPSLAALLGLSGLIVVLAVATLLMRGRNTGDRDLGDILRENGFTELRPPSTLIEPGSWVEIQGRDPLRLRVVCSATNALNLNSVQLLQSISTDTSVTRTFNGDFRVGVQSMGLGSDSRVVESVELHLSNVHVIELSEDQILKNVPMRDKSCAAAITLEYQQRRDSLTMIDTVFVADAEYHVIFSGEATEEARAAATERLAANASLKASGKDTTVVIGAGLVWGVKDNQLMAFQGVGLPSVGAGTPATRRSILKGRGPISHIEAGVLPRRPFGEMPSRVRLDVPIIRQPSSNACWAAVYAMMFSWKAGKAVTIAAALNPLGSQYTGYFRDDEGLPGGSELAFVKTAGMQAMPPADYPLSEYRDILRRRGPAWITTGDGLKSHARLLVGIYGPNEEEKYETYGATVMEFIDPEYGTYVYQSALEFSKQFEREAAFIVDHHLNGVDLRWQIITF
jgi:hypothetical protein